MLTEEIKDPAWRRVLEEEFRQQYFMDLEEKLKAEYESGEIIYPDKTRIFQAFNLTPFYEVCFFLYILFAVSFFFRNATQINSINLIINSNVSLTCSQELEILTNNRY